MPQITTKSEDWTGLIDQAYLAYPLLELGVTLGVNHGNSNEKCAAFL